MKTLFFLWFHPGIRENPHIFRDEEVFFVFTPDFLEFCNEDLSFLVHTLGFEVLKFLCPTPQSRYPGAGPEL